MKNLLTQIPDLFKPLIPSAVALIQISWLNHRSIATIFFDLLKIYSSERYSETDPKVVRLWCHVLIQLNYGSAISRAIKENEIILSLSSLEKERFTMALNLNNRLARSMLLILIQKNPFLGGLCVKLTLSGRVLHDPEYFFSEIPQLFHLFMDGRFIHNPILTPPNEELLQNPPQMREFFTDTFQPDLFTITEFFWLLTLYMFYNTSTASTSTAALLMEKIHFSVVNRILIDHFNSEFLANYQEEERFFEWGTTSSRVSCALEEILIQRKKTEKASSSIQNSDQFTELIPSALIISRIPWWDHRSSSSIFFDLLEISSSKRYLVTNPTVIELWCQMFTQLDHACALSNAIKENKITLPLPSLDKKMLTAVLDADIKLANKMLSILIQENLFLASLCVKICLSIGILTHPESLFSENPRLFNFFVENKFIDNDISEPSRQVLLQNPLEMRELLIASFLPDLFDHTKENWDKILDHLQNLDLESMNDVILLVKNIKFAEINDQYMGRLKNEFEDHYEAEKRSHGW